MPRDGPSADVYASASFRPTPLRSLVMADHHEASSYSQEGSHQHARQSTEQRDTREPHLLNLKVRRQGGRWRDEGRLN